MSLPFIETFRGMIAAPGETLTKSRSASLTDAVVYYLIVIFVYSLLTSVVTYLLGPSHPMPLMPIHDIMGMIVFIIGLFIVGTIALLVLAAIFHICAKIVGGSGDFTASVRACALAETPTAAIGWIPIINILAGIWGFILIVMGFREYHAISTLRAVVAILLPILVLVPLIVLALMLWMVDPTAVTITEVTEAVPRIT